ncbi:phosphatase PAP2 family protein [Ascoidea rubescens DSM 1968]|uniref:PAP2-domain-containing protein n=1 Tax=Ascoidea rubescens DSM 1968 TaxID=1344418 RepID=A0A1D2VGZ7_9ASCO|nr:PAP2-domain-containing protein [Ascoidea rubescens DSM 1968]ODV60763.1 PAP2-domain-containing protein [Ascoidea rubescens DSM 1968]
MSALTSYLDSPDCKQFYPDWIIAVLLLLEILLIGETSKPFERDFLISDASINHPFKINETVNVQTCILLSTIIPILTFALTIFVFNLKNDDKKLTLRNSTSIFKFHLFHVSILSLTLSILFNVFLTDILKNWIARPRPDFLSRCGPDSNHSNNIANTIINCTKPFGQSVYLDGFRSCPSGHSSISFSALFFLSLWLNNQLNFFNKNQPIYKLLVILAPTLLAAFIAISRTQDYRHHFEDIILGAFIGSTFAYIMHFKYFGPTSVINNLSNNDSSTNLLPI